MKVLVTGATGFVGACLTRRLIELGYDVHIFSRAQSNRWRIADISQYVTEHEVDLRDEIVVTKRIADIRPSIIYHLATYGGFAFQKETVNIIESNLLGTVNLLRACEQIGFDYFIHTGSSAEYGMKLKPIQETDALKPVGDYGVFKAAATLFCQSEAIAKGLPVVTLRLFSPYGPWDDPRRLIPYIITSFLRRETPNLSKPTSVRDFIFIEDVLDLLLAIPQKPISTDRIFNLGSGQQDAIGDVAAVIAAIIGNCPAPAWGKVQPHRPEPQVWVADMTKVKSEFNWEPATSLRVGLEKTIMWFKDHLRYYP